MEITTPNYVSVGIVQKIYCKTLNILCYPSVNCFSRFIIEKQCWIDWIICGGYYIWSASLWNFTQPLMIIPFRRFRQDIGIIFNTLKTQVVLTSVTPLDVCIGNVKWHNLCCNYIEILLIKIQILFQIYIKSTSRIIAQDIFTLTLTLFTRLFHSILEGYFKPRVCYW